MFFFCLPDSRENLLPQGKDYFLCVLEWLKKPGWVFEPASWKLETSWWDIWLNDHGCIQYVITISNLDKAPETVHVLVVSG